MIEENSISMTSDRSHADWAAIIMGSVITAAVMLVFTTFAAGLGLGSITAKDGGDISTTWLIITALFIVISMVSSYLLGGYVTGRMRRPVGTSTNDETSFRDGFNGLAVWGIGMLISAFIAASAISGSVQAVGSATQTTVQAAGTAMGGLAQGAGQLGGGIVSGAGAAVSGIAQGSAESAGPTLDNMLPEAFKSNPMDYIIDSLFRSSNESSIISTISAEEAKETARQTTNILANLMRTGEVSDTDKDWVTKQISKYTNLTQADAKKRVDDSVDRVKLLHDEAQVKLDDAKKELAELKASAERTLEEAKAKAVEVAEKARVASILTAFLLAAAALVSGAAAYIGAIHGGRHRDEGRIWSGLSYRK